MSRIRRVIVVRNSASSVLTTQEPLRVRLRRTICSSGTSSPVVGSRYRTRLRWEGSVSSSDAHAGDPQDLDDSEGPEGVILLASEIATWPVAGLRHDQDSRVSTTPVINRSSQAIDVHRVFGCKRGSGTTPSRREKRVKATALRGQLLHHGEPPLVVRRRQILLPRQGLARQTPRPLRGRERRAAPGPCARGRAVATPQSAVRTHAVVSCGSRPASRVALLSSSSPSGRGTGSGPKLVTQCHPPDRRK